MYKKGLDRDGVRFFQVKSYWLYCTTDVYIKPNEYVIEAKTRNQPTINWSCSMYNTYISLV